MAQTAQNTNALESPSLLASGGVISDNRVARFNMIEQQIRTWDVLDPNVLQLLNDMPREHFVPTEYQGLAFADIEIPLGQAPGQSMLSPKLEGRLLQELSLNNTQTVLHIGTGSGYFTALLAGLTKQVNSVEIDPKLSAQAANNLARHSINNVTLTVADGMQLGSSQENYDVIVYTGSSPVEPIGMRQHLNIGGVMLVVLGSAPAMHATLITRISTAGFKETILFETCMPALINAPQAQQFEF